MYANAIDNLLIQYQNYYVDPYHRKVIMYIVISSYIINFSIDNSEVVLQLALSALPQSSC